MKYSGEYFHQRIEHSGGKIVLWILRNFYSYIADLSYLRHHNKVVLYNYGRWRKEFLKKLWFVFRKELLSIFRVEYNKYLAGIKLRKYLGCSFSKPLQKSRSRRESKPNFWYIIFFDVTLIAPVKT